MSEVTRV